ncbi:uroporphyrinogen-III C-methyltransferase [Legionella cardiaca]|uniref:Uroporphyrinogen-III C-methyltransferase n=1 Tax=Legionella cardiaca TaxID=1071983 RepID=A0ABY8AQK6_9GAMM|nr:uroporphyrinogen-III C-methyltransferase [Legionella cardiaca]WED42506.1 uroporphyrinogen-III C-methyltransferase [Legionella cardiaca]
MANNNDVQTKKSPSKPIPEDTLTSSKPAKTKLAAATPSLVFLILSVLALVIAVIALICGAYALKANQQLANRTGQATETLNTEFDILKKQQLQAQSLETSVQTLKEDHAQLQEHLKSLDKELQTAMQQRLYQKQDWILLKARYYLELAQINAHWSNDKQTTIALLQQADLLLGTLSEQAVFAIRQAIAQEITQLQALPKVDVAGLLSQLDAAQTNLVSLPLKHPVPGAKNKTSSEKSASPWREQLRESINSLGKLIVVRRHDENVEPLLSPIQQAMMQEAIRMNLQEAQWAILQNNSTVYQMALTQAIKTIKRAFEINAASTQALIKQLQNLLKQKINIEKPMIEKALPLLNQLIDSKNLQPSTAGSTQGDHSQ